MLPRMLTAGLIAATFVLVGFSAKAGTPTSWEPLEGAGNAEVTVIAATPASSGMAVVGYTNGDVYLTFSKDSDSPNWTQVDDKTGTPYTSLPSGTVTAIAISPFDSQSYFVAFAGCHYPDKLWKTVNGGETFFAVSDAPYCDISSLSVNPVDSSIVYMIADETLYVSEDYGLTWSTDPITEPLLPPIATGDRITAVAPALNNFYDSDEAFLVGTQNGDVWMTLNAGSTWLQLDDTSNPNWPDLPGDMVTSVVFDDRLMPPRFIVSFHKDVLPNTRDALWVSSNGGESWTNITNEDLPNNSGVGMVSAHPNSISTFYATATTFSTFINAYKSEDSGATWKDGCTCSTLCTSAQTTANSYFGTTGAQCFAVKADITGWNAWNTDGRDIIVNGTTMPGTSGIGDDLPAKINDRYYFYFTAGNDEAAGWGFW